MPPEAVENDNGSLHKSRRLRGTQDPLEPHRPRTLVAPAPSLHVICPIFSTKPDKDAESNLLHNSEWLNSQGIMEEENMPDFV